MFCAKKLLNRSELTTLITSCYSGIEMCKWRYMLVITVAAQHKTLSVCSHVVCCIISCLSGWRDTPTLVHRAVICSVASERHIIKHVALKGHVRWHIMSHPVVVFESWIKHSQMHCAMASVEASSSRILPVSAFSYGAPRRDRYIPWFVCQQCPHSGPPGRVMYCWQDEIKRRRLKMRTRGRCARLFSLLKMM